MLRDDLNIILDFIGSESLTDDEFASISITDLTDPNATYLSLLNVLESRESVSDMTSRLQNYFLAQGIQVGTTETSTNAASNIFVGSVLDYDDY